MGSVCWDVHKKHQASKRWAQGTGGGAGMGNSLASKVFWQSFWFLMWVVPEVLCSIFFSIVMLASNEEFFDTAPSILLWLSFAFDSAMSHTGRSTWHGHPISPYNTFGHRGRNTIITVLSYMREQWCRFRVSGIFSSMHAIDSWSHCANELQINFLRSLPSHVHPCLSVAHRQESTQPLKLQIPPKTPLLSLLVRILQHRIPLLRCMLLRIRTEILHLTIQLVPMEYMRHVSAVVMMCFKEYDTTINNYKKSCLYFSWFWK